MKGKCFFCYDYLQSLKLIETYQHDQFNRAFLHKQEVSRNDPVTLQFTRSFFYVKKGFLLEDRATQKFEIVLFLNSSVIKC